MLAQIFPIHFLLSLIFLQGNLQIIFAITEFLEENVYF
ncbi:hypothetical protein Rain11_0988 [Raineya orbicola]|jgi:hypothetical protein|uniref:Uncharacterized protein n=1 Tax=Raineya orbicola TaxID=2016530 RepID=A0A2N3II67_9BACT|nr:hypothetical protein Rain11_0988 [Raineya orbicola]